MVSPLSDHGTKEVPLQEYFDISIEVLSFKPDLKELEECLKDIESKCLNSNKQVYITKLFDMLIKEDFLSEAKQLLPKISDTEIRASVKNKLREILKSKGNYSSLLEASLFLSDAEAKTEQKEIFEKVLEEQIHINDQKEYVLELLKILIDENLVDCAIENAEQLKDDWIQYQALDFLIDQIADADKAVAIAEKIRLPKERTQKLMRMHQKFLAANCMIGALSAIQSLGKIGKDMAWNWLEVGNVDLAIVEVNALNDKHITLRMMGFYLLDKRRFEQLPAVLDEIEGEEKEKLIKFIKEFDLPPEVKRNLLKAYPLN